MPNKTISVPDDVVPIIDSLRASGDDQDLGALDGAGELVEKPLLPMAR